MNEITITRKFAIEYSGDPTTISELFDYNQQMVNFFMHQLRDNSELFGPEEFAEKTLSAAKATYNRLKSFLREQTITIADQQFLERVQRCAFQYAYFILQDYHRRRSILAKISRLLLPYRWWEDFDNLQLPFDQMKQMESMKVNSKISMFSKFSNNLPRGLDLKKPEKPEKPEKSEKSENKLSELSSYELSNIKEQYRNLVLKTAKARSEDIFSEEDLNNDFDQFLGQYTMDLSEEEFDKLQRSFKHKVGSRLNSAMKKLKASQEDIEDLQKRKRQVVSLSVKHLSWAEDLAIKILTGSYDINPENPVETSRTGSSNTAETDPLILDFTNWQRSRRKWRQDQNKQLDQIDRSGLVSEFMADLRSNSDRPSAVLPTDYNVDRLLNQLFKPKDVVARLTSGSVSGLVEYVRSYLSSKLFHDFAVWLGRKYCAEIKMIEAELYASFLQAYPNTLTFPTFRGNSIPLGMDDSRIYRIAENNLDHSFRFKKRSEFFSASFADDVRYTELINSGWTPKRGVLRLSRIKSRSGSSGSTILILCLPFTKEVPDKLESTLVAGVDLGLKDGMVISVYDTDRRSSTADKNTGSSTDTSTAVEVDRRFFDQAQLAGRKDEWFRSPKELEKEQLDENSRQRVPNLKAKLFRLRLTAQRLQSERMRFDHSNKRSTKAYLYLKREEKQCWEKISAIHVELINQYATRLVAYCNYYSIGAISFEDLKWSGHSLKSEVGFYLSHWQTHWFFARIQERTEEIAMRYGITVLRVNARYTSSKCHRCNEMGKRVVKTFYCKNSRCGWQGDADLNAARNVSKRGCRKFQKLLKGYARRVNHKHSKNFKKDKPQ